MHRHSLLVLFLLLSSHLATAAEPRKLHCSSAAWLSLENFCPQNPFAPSFSCALPRACWPCRVEVTSEGQPSPTQESAWHFDTKGRLLRYDHRIGSLLSAVTCDYASNGKSAICHRDQVVSTLTLRNGRVTQWTEDSNVTAFTYDSQGRMKRVVLTQEGQVTSDVTREFGQSGRIDWESDAPGQGVELRYDAKGRFIRAIRVAQDRSRTTEREVTWSPTGKEATLRDGTLVHVWNFSDDGRVTEVHTRPEPGVMGAVTVTRYVYECQPAPSP